MSKSTVLQIIAAFILVIGILLFYEIYTDPEGDKSLILGAGPIICGIALFVISKSKTFKN